MSEKDKRFRKVLFSILEDGSITDKGLHEMLENDNAIREQLAQAGVIRRFLVCDKEPKD